MHLDAGRQAYVVCPLIEASETRLARAAEAEAERLRRAELNGYRIGLLHGRLKAAERREVMRAFKDGELDVLVATTVIEVGVDVPNATIMIVQEADRFGLAQLHQLRGRVGRGAEQSYCLLISRPKLELTDTATARLEALVETSDGFELAERDLELRGEGSLLGARQSGRLGDLRFTRLRPTAACSSRRGRSLASSSARTAHGTTRPTASSPPPTLEPRLNDRYDDVVPDETVTRCHRRRVGCDQVSGAAIVAGRRKAPKNAGVYRRTSSRTTYRLRVVNEKTGRLRTTTRLSAMRIIAGSRKGHRIDAPKGPQTRPTSDFVRENAFNLIGPVEGASVLDLFAGSGALGARGALARRRPRPLRRLRPRRLPCDQRQPRQAPSDTPPSSAGTRSAPSRPTAELRPRPLRPALRLRRPRPPRARSWCGCWPPTACSSTRRPPATSPRSRA